MKILKKYKTILVCFLLTYSFLVISYYLTSVGIRNSTLFLQMRRYIPCALTVAIAISLVEKSGLSLKKLLLPHALVGILWIIVYPACYWFAFHKTSTFIDNHYDQAFGAYFFAFSVCLRIILLKWNAWQDKPIYKYGFSFLHALFLIIPVIQLGYFYIYCYPITEAAAVAVLQTNFGEAKEYLLLNLGFMGIIGSIIFWISLFILLAKMNDLNNLVLPKVIYFGKKCTVFALVIIIATIGYGGKIFKHTGVVQAYASAQEYFAGTNRFKYFHDNNFEQLKVFPSNPAFSEPATIVVVIGESASAYYMSAFSDVKKDNTPWLRSVKKDNSFILFPHVYASWGQTVPALERALTEKNQYNTKEFYQSLTIIDIAKKAGYETYWFSNQGYIGGADTPITLVAQTADHAKWLAEDKALSKKYQYDGDLLEYLKYVDPKKNNFVVLHLMGSHEDCINRYPQDFAKFSKSKEFDMVKNYDDSLAYTDHVLQQVYEYSSKNLNLQAMLYFSDHGGDPYRKRHPDVSGFKFLQIPMFIFVSQEYQKLYGDAVQIYRNNRNKYFTNDMIYEVICDLLRVKSNRFVEENSILNSKYKYTPETLTTNLGKTKLIEDKEPRKDD